MVVMLNSTPQLIFITEAMNDTFTGMFSDKVGSNTELNLCALIRQRKSFFSYCDQYSSALFK